MKKNILLALIALVVILVPTSKVLAQSHMIYVDDDGKQCRNATYTDIPEALANAADHAIIMVCKGTYTGDYLTKPVTLKAKGQAIINNGPAHASGLIIGFRLMQGSDFTRIDGFTFDGVDLAIMNGDGVDHVIVMNNRFNNTVQAISNWRGDHWMIHNNTIKDLRSYNGGGIGILIGAFDGSESQFNTVSNNKITGTLHVFESDGGGYDGTGIVIYADYRWGRTGGKVSHNAVVNNTVKIVSDTPEVVDAIGIELTDTRDDETVRDITNNHIVSNRLRGMDRQLETTPSNLDEFNTLVNNR